MVYLEAVLNDRWDAGMRRIKIVDTPDIDAIYVYQESEEEPVYVYQDSEELPVYAYQEIEIENYEGFIVQVPSFITFDETLMKALINKYNQPFTNNYTIEVI